MLVVELRDVRDRASRHAERAAWLRAQLARAERRAAHWRAKQEAQRAAAERVAALQGELQLLELAERLRVRLGEQQEAGRRLEAEERELARRLQRAVKN